MHEGTMGNQGGITYVEVAVVVFIAALVLLFGLTSFRGFQSAVSLRTVARELAGDLRSTQQYAVTRDEDYRLVVVTAGSPLYRVERVAGAQVVKEVDLPTDVTVTTTFPSDTVTFSPTAAPAAGGRLTVTDADGNALSVCVQTATGRVQIVAGGSCP